MAIQIQFRRGTEAEWASVNPILAEGEMGIETDTDLFKIGDGLTPWNSLDYGGLRGFVGSTGPTGSIGNIAVENVLYVSKSGDDSNDGSSLNTSKLTIKSALSVAENGDTIFVKSGDYTEDNPLIVPEGVAIVGDSLRTAIVRPLNRTEDLFYVDNAVYLAHMTFKDHEAPSSAVAFNPDGSTGVIHTSPYVQNCTSMTTTGTGMRVDGAHVEGLRSMVVDAYTQYNQGGIGIHMLNRGNTQLVSVFTIATDVAFLCEGGGFCSITNSNSSFGNFGLKADGVSDALYEGSVVGETSGDTFTIQNLKQRANVGDAVLFEGDPTFYTVASSTAIRESESNLIQGPDFTTETSVKRNLRNIVLDSKSKIQIDAIDFLNENFPTFDFNQFKCSRDIGLILDAVADDMVFETNYKTVAAARSYRLGTYESNLFADQQQEYISVLEFVKQELLDEIAKDNSFVGIPETTAISNNLDIVIDVITNGDTELPTLAYPDPTGVDTSISRTGQILRNNREFLQEEGIAYITEEYPGLTYDDAKCKRDIGLIIDAIVYDILYSGNSQTADAADEYYINGVLQVSQQEKQPTIETFEYISQISADLIKGVTVIPKNTSVSADTSVSPGDTEDAVLVQSLFDLTKEIIENAYEVTVVLEENVPGPIADGATVTFHQFSLITASGHTFEWVGSGTNINAALPYLGGVPLVDNQVVEVNQGRVYFTGTDQFGDFRIGNDFVINRNTGTIEGRTFTKSLFAVITPYILAIGE